MKRTRFMDELLSETILYGGCTATREEVYQDCIERGLPARGGFGADWFAFHPPAVQEGDSVPALTLQQVRNWEGSQASCNASSP